MLIGLIRLLMSKKLHQLCLNLTKEVLEIHFLKMMQTQGLFQLKVLHFYLSITKPISKQQNRFKLLRQNY